MPSKGALGELYSKARNGGAAQQSEQLKSKQAGRLTLAPVQLSHSIACPCGGAAELPKSTSCSQCTSCAPQAHGYIHVSTCLGVDERAFTELLVCHALPMPRLGAASNTRTHVQILYHKQALQDRQS